MAKAIKSQQNKITYYFADFQHVVPIQFAAVLCILNVVYKWPFINQSSAEINFQMKNKSDLDASEWKKMNHKMNHKPCLKINEVVTFNHFIGMVVWALVDAYR